MREVHDVTDIIEKYLKDNGFDGLQHEDDCGCRIGDLCPCNADMHDCTPGYAHETKDGDFIIYPFKQVDPPADL